MEVKKLGRIEKWMSIGSVYWFYFIYNGGVVKRMLGSYRGNRDFYPWLSVWCIVGWFSN